MHRIEYVLPGRDGSTALAVRQSDYRRRHAVPNGSSRERSCARPRDRPADRADPPIEISGRTTLVRNVPTGNSYRYRLEAYVQTNTGLMNTARRTDPRMRRPYVIAVHETHTE